VKPGETLVVVRGNLAPDGAVMKACAADPKLFRHRGRAVVFEDVQTIADRIDDPELDIDENSVLILRNAGPVGAAMPEWGMLPLPRHLLERGVRDMLRISDARMSGTAYGAAVLHVSPEAAIGGPLALVRDGDFIELDAAHGRLHLDVSDDELRARLDALQSTHVVPRTGGYVQLYRDHVLQADEGCDFDFLVGCRGADVPAHSH
jgi:dihydroxy-acid dehydratase